MWPWEHLVVAYIAYSLVANGIFRRSPSSRETVAVLVGSQLPDLVDKPLAWTLGITETGYSIGHSAFVVPVVCLLAYAVASHYGDRHLAGAFSLAYLTHLGTDVLNPIRLGRGIELRAVLWPIASPPTADHGGFLDHFVLYFLRYANQLVAGGMTLEIAVQFVVAATVLTLWLFDGAPIVADVWRWLRPAGQA